VRVPNLVEGSGIAVSRSNPGRVWAHNDSGRPEIMSLSDRGAVLGGIQLTGASIDDWEAAAVGPCPTGSCLYVGDIGDNDAKRKHITVYRLPEPSNASGSIDVREVFHAAYPDGPHDAESLLITPAGEILVVTKGHTGPIAIYRFPRESKPGTTVELERIAEPRFPGKTSRDDRITDGAVSPSGTRVVLRTNRALYFYAASDFTSGKWREAGRVDLQALGEPQGEGVAFADDSTIYLVGEGGGGSRPGSFARLTCTF
jgi:hypothetical protein